MPPDATARLPLSFPLDLELTLGGLQRGTADPTIRFDANQVWRAARTPDGPATVRLSRVGAGLTADAWGAGAGWMVRHAESLLGFEDHPETFAPANQLLADIHHHHRGLRLGRTGLVFEALLPTILEQKVPGVEAWSSYARLVRDFGEVAPGGYGLFLQPSPSRLLSTPYWAVHRLGIERRRFAVVQ